MINWVELTQVFYNKLVARYDDLNFTWVGSRHFSNSDQSIVVNNKLETQNLLFSDVRPGIIFRYTRRDSGNRIYLMSVICIPFILVKSYV